MAPEQPEREEPETGIFERFELDSATSALLPIEYCVEKNVVPLGRLPGDPKAPISLGVLDPDDSRLLKEVAAGLARRVQAVRLTEFEIRHAISRIHKVRLGPEVRTILALDESRRIELDREQPPAKILDDLLSAAIRVRATDAHIEVYNLDVDFRVRVDGILHQMTTPLTPDNVHRVISRLKVLCGLDSIEHHRPQDGHFTAVFRSPQGSRRVDFRLSVLPGPYGSDAAIRILDPDRMILDLERVFLDADTLERYRRLTRYPSGLILIAGPTDSGKTTTLYATLNSLSAYSRKIVTVEDPIENELPGVLQKNVSDELGFSTYLRAILRQNPDVIMVGEIRDPETAEMATRAATTGHLVLSTVHTYDAVDVIGRLRTLGVSDDYLSNVLIAALGERLLRRLCDSCKVVASPPSDLVREFYTTESPRRFHVARGCESCSGSGYGGLFAIFELLCPDDDLRAAITAGTPVHDIRRVLKSRGFRTLVDDALARVADGMTSLEEVARHLAPRYPRASLPKRRSGE